MVAVLLYGSPEQTHNNGAGAKAPAPLDLFQFYIGEMTCQITGHAY